MAPIEKPLPYPVPQLVGSAFVLRPFRPDDFAPAAELGTDPAAARWVPALPGADGPSVAEFFEEARLAGGLLHLVIARRDTDAYLGEAMLVLGDHDVGEVGCSVVPAARGRGIATESLRLLTDWSFETLGLGRVQVFVATENLPALRLAESAGFLHEGVLRSYLEIDGTRLDAIVLSRIPGDATST